MQNKIIRFYNIGNVIFQYEGPAIKEKENLALFAVEERQPDFIFRVIEKTDIMLPNLPCIDNKGYIHVYANDVQRDRIIYDNHKDKIMMKDICFDGILHTVEYNPAYIKEFDTNIITKLFDIPYHLLLKGGIFLHASYIRWNDSAILFTGPKQMGKSTQAELWKKYRNAEIVNGDRALLRRTDGKWSVYGSPFCGTSGICHRIETELDSIVILSKGNENVLRKASGIEAVVALMDGVTYLPSDKEQVIRVTELMNDLVRKHTFYKYTCCINEEAVTILEETLCQRRVR